MNHYFWRTRKDIFLAWRFLRIMPLHFIHDVYVLLLKIFRKMLYGSNFYEGVKAFAVKRGWIKRTSELTILDCLAKPALAGREKPIIFASYCAGSNFQGNLKFCGGTKELNYLLKLIRKNGYEAYMVTWDGTYEPWLLDHQPHISLSEFIQIVKQGREVRCVTSWAVSKAFIQASPQLYFWDMELEATEHTHFPILADLYRKKICSTASISRTIQAWHMSNFQRRCILIPNLLDESLWSPQPSLRKQYRIGYMNEGVHTTDYIEIIRNIVRQSSLNLEFHLIKGVESEVLDEMRSCNVYLSMNIGKDPLWGEGCPRTILESLSTGCVVIGFDIIGNRETLQDNFNGYIVPRYRPDLMAEALIRIYTVEGEIERLRNNSLNLVQSCHTLDARWSAVQDFLNL